MNDTTLLYSYVTLSFHAIITFVPDKTIYLKSIKMKKLLLITSMLFIVSLSLKAQVKIGDNPGTINANSLLELESTNKGFLPPRVALNSIASVSPLTGTVTAGMLVYSLGGTLTDGYYYWNGTEWKKLDNGTNNVVTKTATTTLTKTETIVLASNDITLTLPVITLADDGLEITIKNIGTHTDLVKILPNGAATIDEISDSYLTRHFAQVYIATNGNWIIKGSKFIEHEFIVDEYSSWTTIQEVVDFLNLHMFGASVIILADASYNLTSTITINLPYQLTFQGLSFGTSNILAASNGLVNKPMFRCLTSCSFKMLSFEATTLTNYGTLTGEDAIRYVGNGTYHEIKDCSFNRFYTTILDSTNAELLVFETKISNAQRNGILVHGGVSGVKVNVSETDFISCKKGVNLDKGVAAKIQITNSDFLNSASTDTGIVYKPGTFTSPSLLAITRNIWNNLGKFIGGFDFTRADGRDANITISGNAGVAEQTPNCSVFVLNSVTTKTLPAINTWYVADWGANTSSNTCKWTIANNRITFQPAFVKNIWMQVSGNLSVATNSQALSICIVKNGATTTRFGETTLFASTGNQPYQFSFSAYLTDVAPGDYFEIFYSNATQTNRVVIMQDVQWITKSN